ncbi:WW domain-containing protein [Colletotrichum higginsianum]|nr:WW domain-containing protein [Colletotrichum higginsianum]
MADDFAPPTGPPPPKAPEVPPGWIARWNDQYKECHNGISRPSPPCPLLRPGRRPTGRPSPGYAPGPGVPTPPVDQKTNPYDQKHNPYENQSSTPQPYGAGGSNTPARAQEARGKSGGGFLGKLLGKAKTGGMGGLGGSSSHAQPHYGGYPQQQQYGGYPPQQQYGGYPPSSSTGPGYGAPGGYGMQGGGYGGYGRGMGGMGGMGGGRKPGGGGMGMAGGMALGAGAGLLGGALIADHINDEQQEAYADGYNDGNDGDDFGGGGDDFGGDF